MLNENKERRIREIFHFIIVGGSATILDYILYRIVLKEFAFIIVRKGISTICAVTYSFFINKNWTFMYGEQINIDLIIKYIVSQALNLCVNIMVNYIVFIRFNEVNLAFVMATGCGMVANFTLQKLWVFKEKEING